MGVVYYRRTEARMIIISIAACMTIIFFEAVMPNVVHTAFAKIVTRLQQEHVDSTVRKGMFRIAEETLHPG